MDARDNQIEDLGKTFNFLIQIKIFFPWIDYLTKYLLSRAKQAASGGDCKGNDGCSIIYSLAWLPECAPGMQRELSPGISTEIFHQE